MDSQRCPFCGADVPASDDLCPSCRRPVPLPEAQRNVPPQMQTSNLGMPVAPPPAADWQAQKPPVHVPPVAPVQWQPRMGVPPQPSPDGGLGIIGLIVSIIGLTCCCLLSFFSPIGLIISIIAYNRKASSTNLAGIIIGAIGTAVFLFQVVFQIYLMQNPEMQQQLMQQYFDQLGMPVPPGF